MYNQQGRSVEKNSKEIRWGNSFWDFLPNTAMKLNLKFSVFFVTITVEKCV